MSDSDSKISSGRTSVRIQKLKGTHNDTTWSRNVIAHLMTKGLLEMVTASPAGEEKSPFVTPVDNRKLQNAWSEIFLTLSNEVQGALSPAAADAFKPEPTLLWCELKDTYGASTFQELACRMETIWGLKIKDDDDPIKSLSILKATYAEVVATGKVAFDTMLFTIAMLRALPASYDPLVQSLYQQKNLTPEIIFTYVQTEYNRRVNAGETSSALAVKQNKDDSQNKKWCDFHKYNFSHTTNECKVLAGKRKNVSYQDSFRANVSSTVDNENEIAQTFDYPATATALFVRSTSENSFFIDSGATDHMVCTKTHLHDVTPLRREVVVGGGRSLWSTHQSTLRLDGTLSLLYVLLVPNLECNLLSVRKLIQCGLTVKFGNNDCTISKQGKHIATAPHRAGLYTLQVSEPFSLAHIVSKTDLLTHWHHRLGHLNFREVFRMGSEGLLDGDWKNVSNHDLAYAFCESCVLGKGRRLNTYPALERAQRPNDLVHIDIWGPARTTSLGGNRYFLTCYDDHSRYTRLYLLKNKSEALRAFEQYIILVGNQCETTIKRVRMDNGSEFTSNRFENLLANNGILENFIPPGDHAQNGRVERQHLTILNSVRTILIDSKLPQEFWAEAANYVTYVRNRIPNAKTRKIPYTIWSGKNVAHETLRPFGSQIYFRDHTESDKLQARYRPGILLGWREDSSSYVRYWDPLKESVNYSRDVVELAWARQRDRA